MLGSNSLGMNTAEPAWTIRQSMNFKEYVAENTNLTPYADCNLN